MEQIIKLTLEIERLEIELKKAILRCNNLELIAKSARQDKIIAASKLGSKLKANVAMNKCDKLSNDEVMDRLRASSYFGAPNDSYRKAGATCGNELTAH